MRTNKLLGAITHIFRGYMKLKTVNINGVGGISSLDLILNDRMNLICGPNGIGKTTVLECIAHLFTKHPSNILKRRAKSDRGVCQATLFVDGHHDQNGFSVDDFEPQKESRMLAWHQHSKYLLSLKVSRSIEYQPLNAVGKDPDKNDNHFSAESRTGLNVQEIKNWFVNRYLYSAHKDAISDIQIENLELAKECFSALNDGYQFSRVMASSNEIMINTPEGEIYFEYLSSGFKSCLSILFGIIKDIELRFKNPEVIARDFDGIILIDELELHLHPEWQTRIVDILLNVFPKAQFVASTHSPHIIQNAESNQIIALENHSGTVTQRSLADSEYGFQGWSIEEVLNDVMGMEDTRTNEFNSEIKAFGEGVSKENYDAALSHFNNLDKMLHPENHLRKLLRLQLAGIKGAS